MTARRIQLAILFGLIPFATAVSQGGVMSANAIPAPAQGAWPKGAMQQGRYFSYMLPNGWKVIETTNGVELNSTDGNLSVNFVGLEGTPGSTSPRRFMENMGLWSKMQNFAIVETHDRPTQNGFETAEYLYTFTDAKGRACKGWAWSAVNNSFGRNNTYGELVWAVAEIWPRDAQFLVAAARFISVSNPVQAFQRDQLIRNNVPAGPGSAGGFNHPNTFTPYSNQAAMSRISDNNARARRDDYPLVDPSTGRTYHGTSETYDHVRGGWVNPNDHTQLLKVVPPGQ